MRLVRIAVVSALLMLAAADVAHLKAKARLVARLAGKHHKRGVLSSVPPFKLGHDFPHVTHSLLKPLVVNYPPTSSVTAVKVPLLQRYPVPVGHRVPVPHPHYGLKFPHHTKAFRPDQHFHHHHHHVAPRPIAPVPVPVPATPVVPIAQPSGTVLHPGPVPSPPVFVQPAPVLPVAPRPVHVLPQQHAHLPPLLPAAQVPLQPAPFAPAPAFPVAPQYVIRPGNALQQSFFASYPRYPLVNFQQYYPLAAPAPTVGQVFLDRPQVPHFHFGGHDVVHQPTPGVSLEPTPTLLHPTQAAIPQHAVHLHPSPAAIPQPAVHLHPIQPVPLDNDGWAPVSSQPHDLSPPHTHPEAHFSQPHEGHFTQEQGTQVFEHHTDEQYHNEYQHQLQQHIQQQIDQAQYEQHLNDQHQLNQDYGAPQLNQEYGQPDQEFSQHGQEYTQHDQEYALHQQQLSQEYGAPQQVEGRSIDAEDTQLYHNHIPLGLQPPINRPLEHFR